MIVKVKKGFICLSRREWAYTFDLQECSRCERYGSCQKDLNKIRRERKYTQVVIGKPENYYKELSDDDITTMVDSYRRDRYLDEVADELKRTISSIKWVYQIIDQLRDHVDILEIEEFYGAKRTKQVVKAAELLLLIH